MTSANSSYCTFWFQLRTDHLKVFPDSDWGNLGIPGKIWMSSFQKTKEIKIIMVGSKVLTSESVLKCFSRFSQYLNRFNSDFDPWIVVGMIIWSIFTIAFVSTRYDGLIKIRISGACWESTLCQIWLNLVKVAKSLREAQVWYKTIKSVVLWGFWRYLTFSQPRVDQGHFGNFGWKRHSKRFDVRTGCTVSF